MWYKKVIYKNMGSERVEKGKNWGSVYLVDILEC